MLGSSGFSAGSESLQSPPPTLLSEANLQLLSVKRHARELGALSGVEPPPSTPRGLEPCPVLAGGRDDIFSEVQKFNSKNQVTHKELQECDTQMERTKNVAEPVEEFEDKEELGQQSRALGGARGLGLGAIRLDRRISDLRGYWAEFDGMPHEMRGGMLDQVAPARKERERMQEAQGSTREAQGSTCWRRTDSGSDIPSASPSHKPQLPAIPPVLLPPQVAQVKFSPRSRGMTEKLCALKKLCALFPADTADTAPLVSSRHDHSEGAEDEASEGAEDEASLDRRARLQQLQRHAPSFRPPPPPLLSPTPLRVRAG